MHIVLLLKFVAVSNTRNNFHFSKDEKNALALLLQIKRAYKDVIISTITMAPIQSKESCKDLYSYGVDNVYLISDKIYAGSDTLITSYILSNAINQICSTIPADFIICGDKTDDSSTGQIGPELAKRLNIPFIRCCFDNITFEEYINKLIYLKNIKKNVLLSINSSEMELIPNIKNIFLAKQKEPFILDNTDLNLDINKVGKDASPTRIINTVNLKPIRKNRSIVNGSSKEKSNFILDIIDKEK